MGPILLTGAGGQLGLAVQRAARARGLDLHAIARAELDLADAKAVRARIEALRPAAVINAAAYTAVDRAETEPEAAYAINRDGAAHLATACAALGARLLHVSTDFVFDGRHSSPYRPDDPPNPMGVYGRSKAEGERAVLEILADRALVLRTAWLYGPHGRNFVSTMLRLMAGADPLRVIADQVGTPTCVDGLAQALLAALERGVTGIHHWTDAGVASWYDFAVAIQEEAIAAGLLARAVAIEPITTAEYPTPARRPAYSVLDKSDTWRALGFAAPHWRVALRTMLARAAPPFPP
jgi:dTDP-4-dehydrorhamnose reductase